MTLDEAIKHARDKAEESREYIVDDCNLEPFEAHCNSQCIKCAEEHEQLAEWLEELKELREIKEEYQKGMDNSYATFMYNKAIDDFFKNIKECSGWTPNCIESWHDVCLTIYTLYQIAEELKKECAE